MEEADTDSVGGVRYVPNNVASVTDEVLRQSGVG
jgi:hypothetical protein